MKLKVIAAISLWGGVLLAANAESPSFDFESDPRNAEPQYRWQAISSSKNAEETAQRCQWSSVTAKSGQYSLMLNSEDFSQKAVWLLKWIPVKSRTVRISGFLKTGDLQPGPEKWQQAMVSVFYFSAPDWKSACRKNTDTIVMQSGDKDWTAFQKTLTLPEDARFLSIQFWLPACKGAAWLDDLKIEEVSEASAEESSDAPRTVPLSVGTNYFAAETAKAPVIDGRLDDWDGISPILLNRKEQVTARDVQIWSGKQDLSAAFFLAYDRKNLYFAAQVKDDKFSQTSPWPTEKVQIALDGSAVTGGRDGYYELSMAIADDGNPYFRTDVSPPGREEAFADARYAVGRDPASGLTVYELAIPWKSLHPFHREQGKIGFSLVAMDNDGAGLKQWIAWTPGLAGGKDPGKFGRIYFDQSEFSADITADNARRSRSIDLVIDRTTLIAGETITAVALFLGGKTPQSGVLTQKITSSGGETIEQSRSIATTSGLNRFRFEQDSTWMKPGSYTFQVSFCDSSGTTINAAPRTIELIANYDGIVGKINELDRKYRQLQALTEKVAAKNIPIPYQMVSVNVIRYGLDEYLADFASGKSRSKWIWGASNPISAENNRKRTIIINRNTDYLSELLDRTQAEIEYLLNNPGKGINIPSFDIHQVAFKNDRIYSGAQPTFVSGMLGWKQILTDMDRFPGLGFNMVAIEGGPNAIVTAENSISAQKIDSYWLNSLNEAGKNNMMINLFMASTNYPGWVKQKHPDLFKPEYALYWERIPCCIDAAVNRRVFEDFFNALVPEIKNHPGLMAYELTTEFTGYVCGCPQSKVLFIKYLQQRHKSLEQLNRSWGSALAGWEQVEIPQKEKSNWGAWYDWCTFNQQRNIDFWQWQKSLIRKHDRSKPIVIGTAYSAGSWVGRYELGVDQEGLAGIGEINGFDGDQFFQSGKLAWGVESMVFSLDFYRSLTPDRVRMDTEFHPLNTVPFEKLGDSAHLEKGIRMMLWLTFLHGTSAVSTYVWHTYGLDIAHAEQNFAVTPAALNSLGRTSLELRRLAPEIVKFFDLKPQVRLLYALPSVMRSEHLARLNTAYESLWFNGVPIGFITERQVANGNLASCPILVAPGVRRVGDRTYREIETYVENGGVLVVLDRESLQFNEYDQRRATTFLATAKPAEYAGVAVETAQYGKGRILVIPAGNQSNLDAVMDRLIDESNLACPVRIADRFGAKTWGIESRSVQSGDKILTYAINLNKVGKKISLHTSFKIKSIQDMINGESLNNGEFELEPMQMILLEITPAPTSAPTMK